MKDIDFDELDRAVSSVLGQPSPDKVAGPETVTQSSPKDTSASLVQAEVTPASRGPISSSLKKDLVQKRRTGRFMDVVPSSRSRSAEVKAAVSRQGVEISPVKDSTPPVAESTSVNSDLEADAVVNTERVDTTVNLEAGTKLKKQISEQDEAQEALSKAADELTGLNGLIRADEGESPLDTPFVSDYDVKKRPLGAFSLGETDQTLLDEDAKRYRDAAGVDESVKSDEKPIEIDPHMNDAIARELRNHEESTNEASVEPEQSLSPDPEPTPEPATKPEPTAAPVNPDELPGELQDEMLAIASKPIDGVESAEMRVTEPVKSEAAPQSQPQVATNNGSITQQYKAESKSQSEEITPVFDTDSYHKPLVHAKKKKSGWLSVILITSLVIVGAGAGAAMYIFDPFNLI